MTSRLSRRLFRLGDLLYRLKYLPYSCRNFEDVTLSVDTHPDTGERCFKPMVTWGDKRHLFWFYVMNAISILCQLGFILVGMWIDRTRDLKLSFRLVLYLWCVTQSFFIALQLISILFGKYLVFMNNTFSIFNIKMSE